MHALKIQVDRIVDFGTIVGVIGVDLATNQTVVVHIDHRPLNAVYNSWRTAGLSKVMAFSADSLTLQLGIDPDSVISHARS